MTTTRKKNVAGYVDEMGRFRPIRSPQFVSHPTRKATRKLASKYSRAKAGDLGKARQERALEDVFAREIRTQAERAAADKRDKARIVREIESDIYGDAGTKGKGYTLAQFVRAAGGIRRTYYHGGKKLRGVERKSYDKGEIDRLSFKQTGKRGLTTDKGGKTLDDMFTAARESGYNVASHDDMMSQIESEAGGGDPTYATHGYLASGYRDNPSRMAKAAISAFDTDYDLDLDLKDVRRLKRGEKKLAVRKATKLKSVPEIHREKIRREDAKMPKPIRAMMQNPASGFAAAIDRHRSLPRMSAIILFDRTPEVLRRLGVADGSISIAATKIGEILKKHKFMTTDVIKRAIPMLADPVMVFRAKKIKSRMVIVTNLFPILSKPVIAIFELVRGTGGQHKINSIYIKTSSGTITKWINDGLLLFINKRKSVRWIAQARLQLPLSAILERYTDKTGLSAANSRLLTEDGFVKKNPLDPIVALSTGLSGVVSALTIRKMMAEDVRKKVMRRKAPTRRKTNGKTAAKLRVAVKRNSPLFGSDDAYTMTVKYANGKVRAVYVIDAKSGKPLANYKTLAGAKRWASANGVRLEVNPVAGSRKPVVGKKANPRSAIRNPKSKAAPAKKNGVVSRFIGRRKAASEYRKELRLQSAIERSRKRRSKAESKAKGNPSSFKWERGKSKDGVVFYTAKLQGKVIGGVDRSVYGDWFVWGNAYSAIKNKGGFKSTETAKRYVERAVKLAQGVSSIKRLRKNPKTTARRRTYEIFQGRRSENVTPRVVSRFAPARMDQLGDLIEIKLADEARPRVVNPSRFKLCAAGGKMWIAGGKFAREDKTQKSNVLNPIGRIDYVVYRTHKPHHGDKPDTHYIHTLGEESGHMPMLAVDREGFPVIRGGKYKIEARGIVN